MLGYIDDDVRLNGQRLDGIPIVSADRLAWSIRTLMIDEVLIGLPRISRARRREIIDALQNFQVQVRVLPSLSRIIDGEVSINDLRAVQIEDLLGREPVLPNTLLFGRTIVGKTILVTGAGGSIGGELCRQIARWARVRLIMLDLSEFALYEIEKELKKRSLARSRSALSLIPVLVR